MQQFGVLGEWVNRADAIKVKIVPVLFLLSPRLMLSLPLVISDKRVNTELLYLAV